MEYIEQPSTTQVTINTQRWHIKRYGRGKTAYLGLHGWAGSHKTFEPFVQQYLPPDSTFFAVDMPGYGKSTFAKNTPTTIYNLAKSLAVIIERLCAMYNIPVITVVGYCAGAELVLFLAEHLGDRVERYVLLEAFTYVPGYWSFLGQTSCGNCVYRFLFENGCGQWLMSRFVAQADPNTSMRDWFSQLDGDTTFLWLQMLTDKGYMNTDRLMVLKTVLESKKIDITFGTNSFSDIKHSAYLFAAVFPNVRLHEIESGHYPLIENAIVIADILFSL
ncbi:hypothetical protein PCE1_003405 [Barthelona sp. PCE]